ncbi:hypothetical protein [Rhodococcoides yunnanense]|uniref:hypothetical protein n=1 Tax=Rhodococcoides yunnanense TaxID=278209 RepID=UPI001FE66E8B|nr:hypothetical protein [Rhodococcus yunnanensis]
MPNWGSLARAADSGDLHLDVDAARSCDEACVEYLEKLYAHQGVALSLTDVEVLGSFDFGIALAKTFSEKAVGGANNVVDALQSHIDVVMQMQAVFQEFFTATATDTVGQDNAAAIAIAPQNPPRYLPTLTERTFTPN